MVNPPTTVSPALVSVSAFTPLSRTTVTVPGDSSVILALPNRDPLSCPSRYIVANQQIGGGKLKNPFIDNEAHRDENEITDSDNSSMNEADHYESDFVNDSPVQSSNDCPVFYNFDDQNYNFIQNNKETMQLFLPKTTKSVNKRKRKRIISSEKSASAGEGMYEEQMLKDSSQARETKTVANLLSEDKKLEETITCIEGKGVMSEEHKVKVRWQDIENNTNEKPAMSEEKQLKERVRSRENREHFTPCGMTYEYF